MKKLLTVLLAAALLAVGASALAAAGDRPGDRVVCVSKQLNEFIYAIGAEDHLVAHDLTSVYPPEITKLPTVGYHRALSAGGIISMRPSVFLTDGNVGPRSVLDQLRKVGIPIKIIKSKHSVGGAQQTLLKLGRYFHREAAAKKVLAKWKHDMAEVKAVAERYKDQSRPRVLLIHFGQIINNYLAVGRGSAADRMIRWAGGVNAIDKDAHMTRLTPELIAKTQPDIILVNQVAFDRFGSAENFKRLPGVSLTPAGKAGRIYRVPEQAIMYYGPRTPATVKHLAELFHK